VIELDKLRAEFRSKFSAEPRMFRAPGRLNIIGEHTDYNDGFVLPCAIDLATFVAGRTLSDRRVRVASLNFAHELEFDLDDVDRAPTTDWTKYVFGVAMLLERSGFKLRGAELMIASDVPVGAGLSSSAALEVSTAFALASLSGHTVDGMQLARLGQAAENEYAGVRSGIMDQFASVFAKKDHALFLDCQSLEWSPIPISAGKFVICNTKTKHDLADGEYNKRRAECEAAAAFLGKTSLRDATIAEVADAADMPDTLRKRARHVVTENARVLKTVEALQSNDLDLVGHLMNESHESLRDDFEVSCAELDTMVNLARENPSVLGARMMGGGFGGCTINLLRPGDEGGFVETIGDRFERSTGLVPEIYECEIADGVSEIL
jgi:galactokinase